MKKILSPVALAVCLVPPLTAQPRYLTLDEARTATRCSVFFGGVAREAQDEKVRSANLAVKNLMLKVAGLSAGPNLMASWLDELEPELASHDGKALMAWNDECKKVMTEHRELLNHVLKGSVK